MTHINRFAHVFTLLLIGCIACTHEEIEQAPNMDGQTLILEASVPDDVISNPLGTKTAIPRAELGETGGRLLFNATFHKSSAANSISDSETTEDWVYIKGL